MRTRHNRLVHNYIGHNYIGHNYVGFDVRGWTCVHGIRGCGLDLRSDMCSDTRPGWAMYVDIVMAYTVMAYLVMAYVVMVRLGHVCISGWAMYVGISLIKD